MDVFLWARYPCKAVAHHGQGWYRAAQPLSSVKLNLNLIIKSRVGDGRIGDWRGSVGEVRGTGMKHDWVQATRAHALIPLGPYSRTIPRLLWWS